jgi:RNA polymerase sigma-70 factor (ECF subfamily)
MFKKDQLNQLYHYALSLCRHEETAYDLVQGAVERFLRKNPQSVEQPLAYVKTTIRHLYFDIQRHNKVVPMVSLEESDASVVEAVDDGMEGILISQQQVQGLISSLNTEENELLYLWAVEEHTVSEIAQIYEKPKGTILSKLHRLKKRIREQLQPATAVINESTLEKNQGGII